MSKELSPLDLDVLACLPVYRLPQPYGARVVDIVADVFGGDALFGIYPLPQGQTAASRRVHLAMRRIRAVAPGGEAAIVSWLDTEAGKGNSRLFALNPAAWRWAQAVCTEAVQPQAVSA
jgi:hypothetical protein